MAPSWAKMRSGSSKRMISWCWMRSMWSTLRRCRDSIELLLGGLFGAAVELGHDEGLLAIAALAEGFADELLAAAVVVIPGIVEEGDAAVEALVDEANGFVVGELWLAEMKAAHADGGDFDAGRAELAVEHFAAECAGVLDAGKATGGVGVGSGEEFFAKRDFGTGIVGLGRPGPAVPEGASWRQRAAAVAP